MEKQNSELNHINNQNQPNINENPDPAFEIGENVTITDRSQLQHITPEKAKIKSLRIENQVIDEEFHCFFQSLDELDSLYFYRCEVDCNTLTEIYYTSKLGLVDCKLTSHSATFVLDDLVRLEYIEILDLSDNKIGVEPKHFWKWWKREIIGVMTVKKIILSNNGFSDDSKNILISNFEKYSPNCQVVF